jgi:hypothetical protein
MSEYERKLAELIEWARLNPGTAGARTIRKIVFDLEGEGPVGAILHSIDSALFGKVIEVLVEFRKTGKNESFNSIHRAARERFMKSKRAQVEGTTS